MTFDDLVEYYCGEKEAKKALKDMGVSNSLLHLWKKNGIPKGRQWWLHAKTGLKADEWV